MERVVPVGRLHLKLRRRDIDPLHYRKPAREIETDERRRQPVPVEAEAERLRIAHDVPMPGVDLPGRFAPGAGGHVFQVDVEPGLRLGHVVQTEAGAEHVAADEQPAHQVELAVEAPEAMADLVAAGQRFVLDLLQDERRAVVVDPAAQHADFEAAEIQPSLPLPEADRGVQQPSVARPHADLVAPVAAGHGPQRDRIGGVFRRKRGRLGRRTGGQRRLGPERLVPARVVIRPGVRFELEAHLPAGKRAQVGFGGLPRFGVDVSLVNDPAAGLLRGVDREHAHAERHAVALARHRHRVGKAEADRRGLGQPERKLDQERADQAVVPRRMDGDHRAVVAGKRFRAHVHRPVRTLLGALPADGHGLRLFVEHGHDRPVYRQAPQGQPAVFGHRERIPVDRRGRTRRFGQLGCEDQDRMGRVLLAP